MRIFFHAATRFFLVTVILAGAAAASSRRASADPDFTLDPASPSLAAIPATAADVLTPAHGAPKWGGQAVPIITLGGATLGLPAGAVIDDFSYGDEVPAGPMALAYSVDRNATGIPMAANALSIEAGAPEGAAGADLYTTTGPLLPGPCGLPPVMPNTLLSDGDGRTAGAPPPRLGLGLDELPPLTYASQDNISGVELEGYGVGDVVYFTVDAPTALMLGVSPSDILARFPFGPPGWVIWAPAGALGLMPGDDIDALAVGDTTMPDLMFTPGADWAFLSLKPGSPSLGPLAHCPGGIPGPASPGDSWWTNGAPLAAFTDAEMLGLATMRFGLPTNDNLDAFDFVTAMAPMDTDGDGADNSVDFDDDNDVCVDVEEPLLVPPINPLNAWDFYSVPVPALIAAPNPLIVFKDDAVGAQDAQSVFAYYRVGSKAGKPSYDQDLNMNGVADGVEYDRTIVLPGPMSGAPDGVITAQEAQLVFAQYKRGYKC